MLFQRPVRIINGGENKVNILIVLFTAGSSRAQQRVDRQPFLKGRQRSSLKFGTKLFSLSQDSCKKLLMCLQNLVERPSFLWGKNIPKVWTISDDKKLQNLRSKDNTANLHIDVVPKAHQDYKQRGEKKVNILNFVFVYARITLWCSFE